MPIPVAEIAFTLKHVAGLGEALGTGGFDDLTEDVVDAILSEAGRFAEAEIAPLDAIGDREGARFEAGRVTMPAGWREAYRRWAEGGWAGLAAPRSVGGQGLPVSLEIAAFEIWNSASLAFALGPVLSIAGIGALAAHASAEVRDRYAPRLVSGEWTGTMNLTEPQSGSDLSGIRCRAEPAAGGTYRLFGEKIYITYGEHDLAENILHLVLARIPGGPPGTRGLSLFLVPKILVEADGLLGAANDVTCRSIEAKLGLHASPTCVMGYGDRGDGAVGWLVGEPNAGLKCMFTMMNAARLQIGLQGVATAEMSARRATAFARDRRQGRQPGHDGPAPIIAHPDVRRMLLRMRSLAAASRAICHTCAVAIDLSERATPSLRAAWQERAALLTPVAKAFSTDAGVEAASLGIQVHGGMGFIEETGVAQAWRDVRVAPIYEGTNGIQAIDLVTRKLPLGGGSAVNALIGELREIAAEAAAANRLELGPTSDRLDAAIEHLSEVTAWLVGKVLDGDAETALAIATPYLRLFGLAAGGALLAKAALVPDAAEPVARRTLLARFFAEELLPETRALHKIVTTGGGAVLAADDEALSS